MRAGRNAVIRACAAALLLAAAARSFATFSMPLRGGAGRAPRIDDAPAAATIPGMEPCFRTYDKRGGAVFARYATGLDAGAALAEASAALLGAGWRQVHSSPSLAIFENRSGCIAVLQSLPAGDAHGASVTLLVQL